VSLVEQPGDAWSGRRVRPRLQPCPLFGEVAVDAARLVQLLRGDSSPRLVEVQAELLGGDPRQLVVLERGTE
jgi:hypothetical protein